MSVASPPRAARIPSRKARVRRARPTRYRRLVRLGQRAFLVLMALPLALRVVVIAIVLLALWSVANWTYQVIRKPTELFFPVSGRLFKTPPETWRSYEALFRAHSTAIMAPELLAALAQVEGAGNPVARTYWRWRLSWNPFTWYQPASSSVGMYQITDGTFREAKNYCIHDHQVVERTSWHDWHGCWFNAFYTRVIPSHAIEMTSALLDRMAGDDAGVEGVEPARGRVVPWTVSDHGVVVDAVALRVPERGVGDLEHSHRARRRAVQLERIPARAPAPARARDGIARALDLGERGEQLGRDHGGGMLAKERSVLAPGLERRLRE